MRKDNFKDLHLKQASRKNFGEQFVRMLTKVNSLRVWTTAGFCEHWV